MTEEDEEFNRIEREAAMRKESVKATMTKRGWVGLTDAELVKLSSAKLGPYDLCLEVEETLREKNT